MAERLTVRLEERDPDGLELGAHFDHVDYYCYPFDEQPADHREDYVRLEADLRQTGMVNPLICKDGRVLIGMRRCEIARKLKAEGVNGWDRVAVWEINEDISKDADAKRVLALRDNCYGAADY